ncbi:2-amino-4-hydroxy-6-hydroxymethyldihydropteridine diphosphokinase [Novosphingobium aquimarinum]|uniref:2-amino-4-hydroxy-6- hydroxymethyldihydropteridine diphosphokinase n=1 Tax=Novosphingobium aquimarinum TaxID=2682494 RepID=UPI0012EBE523|nr:2-amino-4-hydroxy-6-hydroxymethyldihydropteridine diphosphokinase [Novosphingobium aquimarinum]
MARYAYLLALGSNRRHGRHGSPRQVVAAACDALGAAGCTVEARSPIVTTAPLGPSRRRYANAAAVVATDMDPPALLVRIKQLEKDFGRRRNQRWGARVLDVDIILWSGGRWQSRALGVPHGAFRQRDFVLAPALAIAPDWRDPVTGLSLRHLFARLTHPRPAPR